MISQQLKDQTLALAGVFQAAELVRQAASGGKWSGYAAEQSVHSLFELQPESVEDVYAGGEFSLNLGLRTMQAALSGNQQDPQTIMYAVDLLRLERKYRQQGKMRHNIGSSLKQIQQLKTNGSESATELELMDQQVEAIGELYQQTISKMSKRIVVQGKPVHLKNERTLSWIRALLFAGLRSARLWVQVGGSRWDLVFGRKKILQATNQIIGKP